MSSIAANALNPVSLSYDKVTKVVTVYLLLATAGSINSATKDIAIRATNETSNVNASRILSQDQLRTQVDEFFSATGQSLTKIKVVIPMIVNIPDTIYLTIVESDSDTTVADRNIINNNSGSAGVLFVVDPPGRPTLTILSKTLTPFVNLTAAAAVVENQGVTQSQKDLINKYAGAGLIGAAYTARLGAVGSGITNDQASQWNNYMVNADITTYNNSNAGKTSLTALTVRVEFGPNGGADLTNLNLEASQRNGTYHKSYSIPNIAISETDENDGSMDYQFTQADLANFVNMPVGTTVVLLATVENAGAEDSAPSAPKTISSGIKFGKVAVSILQQGGISSLEPGFKVRTALPADPFDTLTVQYRLKGSQTWTGTTTITRNGANDAQLRSGIYDVIISGLDSSKFYEVKATVEKAANGATRSNDSDIVTALSSIKLVDHRATAGSSYNPVTEKHTFRAALSSNVGLDVFVFAKLLKDDVMVGTQQTASVTAGTPMSTITFPTIGKNSVTAGSIFKVVIDMVKLLTPEEAAINPPTGTLAGNDIITIGSFISDNILGQPVDSTIDDNGPSLGWSSVSDATVSGKKGLVLAWKILGSSDNYILDSIVIAASQNSDMSSPFKLTNGGATSIVLNSVSTPTFDVENLIVNKYNNTNQVEDVPTGQYVYVSATVKYLWKGAAANATPVEKSPVVISYLTNSITPIPRPTASASAELPSTFVLNATKPDDVVIYDSKEVSLHALEYVLLDQYGSQYGSTRTVLADNFIQFEKWPIPPSVHDQNFSAVVTSIYKKTGSGFVRSTPLHTAEVFIAKKPVILSLIAEETTTTVKIIAVIDAGKDDSGLTATALVPYLGAGSVSKFSADLVWDSAKKYYSATLDKIQNSTFYGAGLVFYVAAQNSGGASFARFPAQTQGAL